MYLSFYGLREAPFAPTPDPKFLFQSARHREALAARERRMETEMTRMRAEHEELRTALSVLRQSKHDLAREIAGGMAHRLVCRRDAA